MESKVTALSIDNNDLNCKLEEMQEELVSANDSVE